MLKIICFLFCIGKIIIIILFFSFISLFFIFVFIPIGRNYYLYKIRPGEQLISWSRRLRENNKQYTTKNRNLFLQRSETIPKARK